MASSSFTTKRIRVSLTLASGQFGANLGNEKIVEGLRVECSIEKGGEPSKNACKLKIYGMVFSDMMQLANLGIKNPLAIRNNRVRVEAGDASRMSIVFQGEAADIHAEFVQGSVCLVVDALAGYYASCVPAAPSSTSGKVPVANKMATLAKSMGYSFEDSGVTSWVTNPYLVGSFMRQAQALAKAANIEFGIDDGVLFIAPRGTPRISHNAVIIAPDTGMHDYPVVSKKGLVVSSIFDPNFKLNGVIKVEGSLVVNANGLWRVHGLKHELSCENPGGRWETVLTATKIGA